MKTAIRFTDTAKEDLRNIAVYLAEQAGAKEPAIRFVNAKDEIEAFFNPSQFDQIEMELNDNE